MNTNDIKLSDVKFESSFGVASQLPPSDLPEVIFAGRSNVGKSSLINKFFNRKSLARVSSMPGKTITINFFSCSEVMFVDLPGYGYAKRSRSEQERFSKLIDGYFAMERDIALVILLLDMRHPPSKDDQLMINFLRQVELPFIVALTKADKLNKTNRAERLSLIHKEIPNGEDIEYVITSSSNGEGMDNLLEAVKRYTYTEPMEQD